MLVVQDLLKTKESFLCFGWRNPPGWVPPLLGGEAWTKKAKEWCLTNCEIYQLLLGLRVVLDTAN